MTGPASEPTGVRAVRSCRGRWSYGKRGSSPPYHSPQAGRFRRRGTRRPCALPRRRGRSGQESAPTRSVVDAQTPARVPCLSGGVKLVGGHGAIRSRSRQSSRNHCGVPASFATQSSATRWRQLATLDTARWLESRGPFGSAVETTSVDQVLTTATPHRGDIEEAGTEQQEGARLGNGGPLAAVHGPVGQAGCIRAQCEIEGERVGRTVRVVETEIVTRLRRRRVRHWPWGSSSRSELGD